MELNPEEALEHRVGKEVLVIFHSGDEREGKLKTYDDYMNVTLLTSEDGEIFIKGSKIRLISCPGE